jgi:hypothetical protein
MSLTHPEFIWDVEGELEVAITKCFGDQFAALSAQDKPLFQKDRPRAEVEVILGAGQGHYAMKEYTGLELDVEDSWDCSIQVEIVTPAAIAVQSQYRVQARAIMARLPALVNGSYLVNHVIYEHMRHMGSPILMYDPERSLYVTRLVYKTLVSVHTDTWAKAQVSP